MKSTASSVEGYLDSVDATWKAMIVKLRNVIKENLPPGFAETMSHGMIGYVVPLDLYPNGYHVNPKEPLPYIDIAARKNNVAMYHMGLHGNAEIRAWFVDSYIAIYERPLDMGKGCFRFKNDALLPYDLIKELVRKISVEGYIEGYERARKGT